MNYKTTIALLALLVMVGGYFIFVERDATTAFDREQQAPSQRKQLGAAVFTADQLSTESIASVSIQRADASVVELTKRDQDWYQTQPVHFALNTWSARQIVDDAAGLHYTQRLTPADTDDEDLPTLGQALLDPPQAVVTLEAKGEPLTRQTIQLGRMSIGGRSYAMINDDPRIYVVNDALHRLVLDGKITDWRKTSLDVPTQGQARRVTIDHEGQAMTMEKKDGDWQFASPHNGRVDPESIKSLLAAVGAISIRKFEMDNPPDLSVYGLDLPVTSVSIQTARRDIEPGVSPPQPTATQPARPADSQSAHENMRGPSTRPAMRATTHKLSIGAPVDLSNEQYFATWTSNGQPSGVVFVISESDANQFDKTINDHRDPRITPVKATDVRELTIRTAPDNTCKLIRDPSGWSFGKPGPDFEADSTEVSKLVESIAHAKAQSFEPRSNDLGEPVATLTLAVIGRNDPEVLRIYAARTPDTPDDPQPTQPVLRNDEAVVYHVPTEALSKIFRPVEALRQKTVVDLTPSRLKRIVIEHPGGPRYVFQRSTPSGGSSKQSLAPTAAPTTQPVPIDGDSWTLVGYERFEAQVFGDLLQQLTPLRIKRWLATDTTGDTPQDQWITMTLEETDGQTHTLVLDPDRQRGSLVKKTHEYEWFELDEQLVGLLQSEFRDRTVLAHSISDIKWVKVVGQEKSWTIRRNDDGTYVADQGQEVDQSAAGNLFDTLAGLRVERFIQPAHVPQPPVKIILETRDGRTHRLAFLPPEKGYSVATNGDQWFMLNAETVKSLNAPLTKKSP